LGVSFGANNLTRCENSKFYLVFLTGIARVVVAGDFNHKLLNLMQEMVHLFGSLCNVVAEAI
jgi:hypothetical protein